MNAVAGHGGRRPRPGRRPCSASCTLALGPAPGRPRLLRAGPALRLAGAGRRRAGRRRHGVGAASATTSRSHYVADNGSREHAAALHDHRHVVGAGGVDPAVGAGAGRLPGRHGPPLPQPGHRPAGGAGPRSSAWSWPPSSSPSWPARPTRSGTWRAPSRSTAPAPTRCCRTTRWWPSTRRCSTWATSGSPSRSPSPSPRWSPAAWARAGWSRPAAGRCSPGASSPSASSSAPGGPTRCWAGAATGRGTRWRTPRSCPG